MRRLLVAFALSVLAIAPAHATASLSCSFGDANLALEVEGTISRGVGEGVMNFGGTLEIKAQAAAIPENLRKTEFDLSHLTQRWLYGTEVKLRLYRERGENEPHGYVELIIETKRAPRAESSYRGSYLLIIYDVPVAQGAEAKTVTLRGRAACSVE